MKEAETVVFVVDDDAPTRESLNNLIRSVGLKANLFASAQEFLRSQPANVPSCLVLDVRMPGLSGLDLQARTAEAGVDIPIIFITGHGDIPMSVRAMKAGAVEFLTKPFRDQICSMRFSRRWSSTVKPARSKRRFKNYAPALLRSLHESKK